MTLRNACAAAALVALAASAFADRVITLDNRALTPKKAREKDGGYVLEFEHGTIVLKDKSLVKAVEIEGDMSEYVPQNDDEKQKLAQGFVRYRGKWMSKPAYGDELKREAEASKKRADEFALHSEWGAGWTKETKHFLFETNTSPELLERYSELLETYYDLMDRRFGINPPPELRRTKMQVRIFKAKSEFHKVGGEDDTSVMGYFNRADGTLNFYHNYKEPAQTEWVALHECTHLLTYLIDPQYFPQIWLNEAVADYFGSSEIRLDKKGKLEIVPGKLQTDRLLTVQNAIKDGNDTKLDQLFDLSRDQFDGFQYAHAWAFIYFLNEASPKYQKGFDRFFKDLYTGSKSVKFESVPVPSYWDKSGHANQAPPAEIRRVVLAALGVKDLDLLEKEWKSFVARQDLSGPEARFKNAYIQVIYMRMFERDAEKTRKNQQNALADLDAAIAAGLDNARVRWVRGRVLNLLDRDDDAKKDLLRAIELDPLAAQYHWDYGTMLYLGFAGLGDEEDAFGGVRIKGVELSPEAREHLGLAAELAPEAYGESFANLVK